MKDSKAYVSGSRDSRGRGRGEKKKRRKERERVGEAAEVKREGKEPKREPNDKG